MNSQTCIIQELVQVSVDEVIELIEYLPQRLLPFEDSSSFLDGR